MNAVPIWYDKLCILNSILFGIIGVLILKKTSNNIWGFVLLSSVMSITFRTNRMMNKCSEKWGLLCNKNTSLLWYLDVLSALLMFYFIREELFDALILILMFLSWYFYGYNNILSYVLHTCGHYLGSFLLYMYLTNYTK